MMATSVMMMSVMSWELMAGNPSAKVIRNKTSHLSMGGNNTNRASLIFKPRRNIATCMMMTRKIMC